VLLLAVVGLAWNWSVPGRLIYGIFIEYWMHFALGACLYFALCVFTDRRSRRIFVGAVLLMGLASAVRLFPWTPGTLDDSRSMVELAFLSAVTLSLFFLRPLSSRISRMALWRPIAALGAISYSLYLVHQFNLSLIATIAQRALPAQTPHFLLIIAIIGLHLALATVFWYLCERPFLGKKSVPPLALHAAAEAARAA
jgi:peptidoglycan/LPS O-acetylase OafA/YrhL